MLLINSTHFINLLLKQSSELQNFNLKSINCKKFTKRIKLPV